MKKTFLSMLAVAGLLTTSCQKDADLMAPTGAEQNVTISVALESASGTRAISAYGTGDEINRCILEVYTSKDDLLYKRMYAKVDGGKASFDLRLVNSQSYDFVAWADCDDDADLETDNYYTTNNKLGLKDICYSDKYQLQFFPSPAPGYAQFSTQPNNDKMDAFSASQQDVAVSDETVNLKLTRPFGQLNFSTKLTDVQDELLPKYLVRQFNTWTSARFDACSGDIADANPNDPTSCLRPWDRFQLTNAIENNELHLSSEFVFAPKTGETLQDITLSFRGTPETTVITSINIPNIPIKRNYRTNVSGELMTVNGHINITVDHDFTNGDGDNYVTGDVSVADINAAQGILDGGVIGDVKLVVKNMASGNIKIPTGCKANSIAIQASSIATDAAVTIEGADYAKTVKFSAPLDTQFTSLTIDTPLAHVEAEINAGTAYSTTSTKTFVVLPNSIIGKLEVKQGSLVVESEAKVTTVAVAPEVVADTESTIEIKGTVDAVESTEAGGAAPEFTSGIAIGDVEYLSIQAAVDAAIEGDVIELAEGKYIVSQDEKGFFVVTKTDNITIQGAANANVVVTANDITDKEIGWTSKYNGLLRVESNNVTIKNITINPPKNFALKGFDLQGNDLGYGEFGRTVVVYNSNGFVLDNCVVNGGNIQFMTTNPGVATIQNSKINNTSMSFEYKGDGCTAKIVNSIIDGSTALKSYNYLIKNYMTDVTFDGCEFINTPEVGERNQTMTVGGSGVANFKNSTVNGAANFGDYVYGSGKYTIDGIEM